MGPAIGPAATGARATSAVDRMVQTGRAIDPTGHRSSGTSQGLSVNVSQENTMRALRTCTLILALMAASPALAQQPDLGGPGTIVPGSGPGTNVHGMTPGPLMQGANAEDAAKRQKLKPVTFLTSKMIGVEVRNAAGGHVGSIEDLLFTDGGTLRAVVINISRFLGLDDKQIAVEPGALILRPGGDRFTAVLDMGSDTIAAAEPFNPAKALATR